MAYRKSCNLISSLSEGSHLLVAVGVDKNICLELGIFQELLLIKKLVTLVSDQGYCCLQMKGSLVLHNEAKYNRVVSL